MEQSNQFNASGGLKKFGYRNCKFHTKGFHLVKHEMQDQASQSIGDYIILNTSEERHISEKKVGNLVNLLNQEPLEELGKLTASKTLYEIGVVEPQEDEEDSASSGSSGSGGGFIMRGLGKEGITVPDAMISLTDAEAYALFKDGIAEYCEALSVETLERSRLLYGQNAPAKAATGGAKNTYAPQQA